MGRGVEGTAVARLQAVAGGAGCAALAGAGSGIFSALFGAVPGKAAAFFGHGRLAGSGVLAVHLRQIVAKTLAADLSCGFLPAAEGGKLVAQKAAGRSKKRKKQKNTGKKFGNPLEKDSWIDV